MTHRDDTAESPQRPAYAAPRLTVYGDMRALTAASSNKAKTEGKMNPGNTNRNRP